MYFRYELLYTYQMHLYKAISRDSQSKNNINEPISCSIFILPPQTFRYRFPSLIYNLMYFFSIPVPSWNRFLYALHNFPKVGIAPGDPYEQRHNWDASPQSNRRHSHQVSPTFPPPLVRWRFSREISLLPKTMSFLKMPMNAVLTNQNSHLNIGIQDLLVDSFAVGAVRSR